MKTFKCLMLLFTVGLVFTACEKENIAIIDPADQAIDLRSSWPDDIALPMGFKPEGIVIGNGHTGYVGSFTGAIWKMDLKTGDGELLVAPTLGSPVVGLSYDHRSNYVFAAGGNTGGVKVFDAANGQLVMTYSLTAPPITWINDLVVTKNALYITDSFRPFLYKIPLGPGGALPLQSEIMEIALTGDWIMNYVPGAFGVPINANGIDATPDGEELVIVHSDFGLLFKVDPQTGFAQQIDLGEANVIFGDGILLKPHDPDYGGYSLYVVQGLINQLTQLHLPTDLLSGTIENVLNVPAFQIPSTVDDFGQSLYVVNARFDVASPSEPSPDIEFNVVRVEK